MPNKKKKIAIISLTSCEGCEVAVLDLGERLLEALNNVELVHFKYMMEAEVQTLKNCDIVFVEGSPTNEKDIKLLKEARTNSKKLIALGNCAHLGGVQQMKNYGDKEKIAKYVYEQYKEIENNGGGGIEKYVEVDGVIPGCPINKEEFLKCAVDALAGKEFKITENPVCYECLSRGYECLLQKGEICLGLLTLGGCDAVCLKSKQACWGCRGYLKEVCLKNNNEKMESLRSLLKNKKIENVEEVFGVK